MVILLKGAVEVQEPSPVFIDYLAVNYILLRSEFIFCHEDGEWIKTDAYITFLRRLCTSLGFKVTNNHALRMSLNSNVLIPLGISAPDRAAMLGHSVETNLRFYSYAQKGYIEDVRNRLNTGFNGNDVSADTSETPKIVNFSQIRKPGTPEKSRVPSS